MSDVIAVSAELMGAMAERISAITRDIHEILNALEAHLSRLRGEWSGAAAEAYDRAQSEWMRLLAKMMSVLDGLRRLSQALGENYMQTEQKNARSW